MWIFLRCKEDKNKPVYIKTIWFASNKYLDVYDEHATGSSRVDYAGTMDSTSIAFLGRTTSNGPVHSF
ncbi:hypothetical protein BDA96_02G178300 [Sorghum bicolor]|uniref:Uncharacterized protein n=2 Tax=Sorghum bicolor TaxID=4558 RepID=A0A1B6QBY6_SORBI|nr:hypothetical protein BDA96_02G178300 [Sorghum bicolor]KXG35410.1 hypothetical protein SORBI_3002G170000 [Sorghum bicolor]KXG35411.1 hypothetical protein SORBI_3002G170000 [Sorghum bicolor]